MRDLAVEAFKQASDLFAYYHELAVADWMNGRGPCPVCHQEMRELKEIQAYILNRWFPEFPQIFQRT